MSDATVTRLGQIQNAGATDALWLKIFAGEVITAFEIAVKLRDKVRTRSIRGAKSAQFPATFRANTRYHTPGTEIVGDLIQQNEVVITLDDMLISDVFVAQIDELKNHYDVRAPFAMELGRAQALAYDRSVSNTLVQAARTSTELFTGDGKGTILKDQPDIGASADFAASGADLISGFNLAKQRLEENQVPVELMTVNAVIKPAQWYLVANSDKALNRFYSDGSNNLQKQVLRTVSDIEIVKSIAPLFGYNVSVYNSSTNATGIITNATDASTVIGTNTPSAANLPYGQFLPYNYPTKYQSDQTKTVGLVWVEPAVAMLNLLGLTMETAWDVRRQGTLMLAKSAIGAGVLRQKCAVELQKH